MLDLENGLVNGRYDNSLNGLPGGLMGQHQQISEVNTFIFTIKTTSTKTVALPLVSTGTYNFYVDWGDGVKDYVRTFSQLYSGETAIRTHTYPTALKEYTVKITGVCRGWNYQPLASEQPKLISVERWGCLELLNDVNGQYFVNCTNADFLGVKDVLNLGNVTSMFAAFAFSNRINLISNWNVRNVVDISFMFQSNTKFNQSLIGWNTGSVTNMNATFIVATAFDQDISNWNVSGVTSMNSMFSSATAFDQDIGSWNVSKVTDFTSFMNGKTPSTFSTSNLDAIYNGWISNLLKLSLSISFGNAKYTAASTEGKALLTRANTSISIIAATTFSGTIIINTSTPHGLVTGNKAFVSGVSGTVEANGLWTVTYIGPTQVELQGSTFVNAYTLGGELRTGYGWTITDGGI